MAKPKFLLAYFLEAAMMGDLYLSQKQNGKKVEIKVDDRNVLITERSYFKTTTVPVSIELIDPTPVEYKSVSSRSLILGGVLASIAIIFFIIGLTSTTGESGGFYIMGAFIGMFSIGNFITAYTGRTDVYVFTNRNNGQTLFAVSKFSPSRMVVDKFVKSLESHLDKIRYSNQISPEQKFEIYMRHLVFLLEEKVLSQHAFEESSDRLKELNKTAPVIRLV